MPGKLPRPVDANWTLGRLSFFYGAFLLVALALVGRLINLEVMRGQHYAQLSTNNFLLNRTIDAPRGTIHDRHGDVFAFNRATFSVSMSPGTLTSETIRGALLHLGRLLGRNFGVHHKFIVRMRPKWRSYPLMQRLTLDEVTAVLEQRYALPGIAVEPKFQRYYPLGSTLCHILGRVGKITRENWKRPDQKYQQAGYEYDDEIGVTGIELAFEQLLRGQKGLEQVWQSGRGRILNSDILEAATPGSRLLLTIDLGLQRRAESLLTGLRGVILAADPRDGEILAWASAPGYDLNRPTDIPNVQDKPKINRAIQEYYQPGSSFKIITAVAALERGWDPKRQVSCGRYFYLPGWGKPFKCLHFHGPADLVMGLQKSCNVQFYTLADFVFRSNPREAGMHLVHTAERFGFATHSGVGAEESGTQPPRLGEMRGAVPTFEQLKRSRGSLLHLAIGQGLLNVTPLQMLMAYAALANGGELLTPRLIKEMRGENDRLVFRSEKKVRWHTGLKPEHRDVILRGLFAAVSERSGTASRAGMLPEWKVAGKTSTAERAGHKQPDAWFIGFAPVDAPEIVVLVLLEESGHGGAVAAPLAQKMFELYFQEKAREQPQVAPTELADGAAASGAVG